MVVCCLSSIGLLLDVVVCCVLCWCLLFNVRIGVLFVVRRRSSLFVGSSSFGVRCLLAVVVICSCVFVHGSLLVAVRCLLLCVVECNLLRVSCCSLFDVRRLLSLVFCQLSVFFF